MEGRGVQESLSFLYPPSRGLMGTGKNTDGTVTKIALSRQNIERQTRQLEENLSRSME